MANATVTSNTFNLVNLPSDGNLWYTNQYSANWSTVGHIINGVAGKAHYITHIHVRLATATSIILGSGSGVDVVTTKHIGPIPVDAASGVYKWEAPPGMGLKCTDDTEFCLETADAAPLNIEVRGKTCSTNLKR